MASRGPCKAFQYQQQQPPPPFWNMEGGFGGQEFMGYPQFEGGLPLNPIPGPVQYAIPFNFGPVPGGIPYSMSPAGPSPVPGGIQLNFNAGPSPVPGGIPLNFNAGPSPVPGGIPLNFNAGPSPVPGGIPLNFNAGPSPVPGGIPFNFNGGPSPVSGDIHVNMNPTGPSPVPGGMPFTFNAGPSPVPGGIPFNMNPGPAGPASGMMPGGYGGPQTPSSPLPQQQHMPHPGPMPIPNEQEVRGGGLAFAGSGFIETGWRPFPAPLSQLNTYPPSLTPQLAPPGWKWFRRNELPEPPKCISGFGINQPWPMYPFGLPGVTNPPGTLEFVRNFVPEPEPEVKLGTFPPTPPDSPTDNKVRIRNPYSNVIHVLHPNGLGIAESHYYPYDLAIIDEMVRLLGLNVKPAYDPNIARFREEQASGSDSRTQGPTDEMTPWQEFKQNGKETELFSDDERDRSVVVDETGAPVYVARYRRPKNRSRSNSSGSSCCVFCRANGEPIELYASHEVHAKNGKTTCPILRKYICPICGGTGDKGHTIRYCPKNDSPEELSRVNTGRNASGLISYGGSKQRYFKNRGSCRM